MEKRNDDFECMQCGECCTKYSLDLPDGSRKKAFTKCSFLEEPNYNGNGRLDLARCGLHETPEQPDVCRDWPFGKRKGVCEDGILVWSRLASKVGLHRIPERIEALLEARAVEREKTRG